MKYLIAMLAMQSLLAAAPSLDELALEAGTDKSSAFHHYTKTYERFFEPLRNQPIKFLEIGIDKGNSVKLWENYFPLADLHFIDVTAERIEYQSTRSQYHFLDQANINNLIQFAKTSGGNFDVIIDDGGHLMHQQLNSFHALFPLVKSGGLYIIEDLHTSYWKTYGGNGSVDDPKSGHGTCIEALKQLVEKVNFPGARTACADIEKMPASLRAHLDYYQEHIEGIYFFSSVCIIEKR